MIMDRMAVMGAAMKESRKESPKASRPWASVKTWMNHFGVSE